jgi:hypothetical protein
MKKIAYALGVVAFLFLILAFIFPGYMTTQRSRHLTTVIAQEYGRMTRTRVQAAEVETLEQFHSLYPGEKLVMSQTTRAALEQQEGKYQVTPRDAVVRFIYVKSERALIQLNYTSSPINNFQQVSNDGAAWALPIYSNGVKTLWHSSKIPPAQIECQYALKIPIAKVEEQLLQYNFSSDTFQGFFMPIVEAKNGIGLGKPDMSRLSHIFYPTDPQLRSRWQITLLIFAGLSLLAAVILFLLATVTPSSRQAFPNRHFPQSV